MSMFDFLQNMMQGGGGSSIPNYFQNAFPATALNNQNLPGLGFGAKPGAPMGAPPSGGIPNYFQQANPASALQNQMTPGYGFGSPAPTPQPPQGQPQQAAPDMAQNLQKLMAMQAQMNGGQQQQQPPMGGAPQMPQMPPMGGMQRPMMAQGSPMMNMPGMMQRRFLGQG